MMLDDNWSVSICVTHFKFKKSNTRKRKQIKGLQTLHYLIYCMVG